MFFDDLTQKERSWESIQKSGFPEVKNLEIENKPNFDRGIRDCLKLGLLKRRKSDLEYEFLDEGTISVIYAKALLTRAKQIERHTDTFTDFIFEQMRWEYFDEAKEQVEKIGSSPSQYVLLCMTTTVLLRSFKESEIFEQIIFWFETLFKKVSNLVKNYDKQYDYFIENLTDSFSSTDETIAYVFLCAHQIKNLSVHIWYLINPGIRQLLSKNIKEGEMVASQEWRNAYKNFMKLYGFIPDSFQISKQDVGKMQYAADQAEVSLNPIFTEGCIAILYWMEYMKSRLKKELECYEIVPDYVKKPEIIEKKGIIEEDSEQREIIRLKSIISDLEIERERERKRFEKIIENLQAQNNDLQKKIQTQNQKNVLPEKTPKKNIDLTQKRILIIGGHQRWHTQLKKIYPDWIFIKGEQGENIPSPDLEKIDAIFFYTKHMSHGLYQRYVSQCRNKAIPFYYLKSLNVQSVINEIQEVFES